jgi:hypothetical protein
LSGGCHGNKKILQRALSRQGTRFAGCFHLNPAGWLMRISADRKTAGRPEDQRLQTKYSAKRLSIEHRLLGR